MIRYTARRLTWFARVLLFVSPARRRQYEAEQRAIIREMVMDEPHAPIWWGLR